MPAAGPSPMRMQIIVGSASNSGRKALRESAR
jgi:hypothetical protein